MFNHHHRNLKSNRINKKKTSKCRRRDTKSEIDCVYDQNSSTPRKNYITQEGTGLRLCGPSKRRDYNLLKLSYDLGHPPYYSEWGNIYIPDVIDTTLAKDHNTNLIDIFDDFIFTSKEDALKCEYLIHDRTKTIKSKKKSIIRRNQQRKGYKF